MIKLGFIINPLAGIGGKVGLKGSDGKETQAKALSLGAKAESGAKAALALSTLRAMAQDIEIYTYPGPMGADVAQSCGFPLRVLGQISDQGTTAEDTIAAARALREAGVDLLLFAGGDGTARNILDAVGTDIPVLGIPTGCKIHSAVYGLNPRKAGEITAKFAQAKLKETREAEVMDIDEELFRQGIVEAKLYGYLRVLQEGRLMQNLKSGRSYSEAAAVSMLSYYIAETLLPDTLYIIGSGSTTKSIMEAIGLPNTLLGVDIFYNRRILVNDARESDILEQLAQYPKAKIIVTVIGGQGYVFGRGNQQLSAEVLRRVGKENIIIAASKQKMLSLPGKELYVDTGDEEVNRLLSAYYRVVTGPEEYLMYRLTD